MSIWESIRACIGEHLIKYMLFFAFLTDPNLDKYKLQCSFFHAQVLDPLKSQAVLCTEMLKDTGDGKQDTHQKLTRQRDKVPNTNSNSTD